MYAVGLRIENPESTFGRACQFYNIPGRSELDMFYCQECPVIRQSLVDLKKLNEANGQINVCTVDQTIQKNMNLCDKIPTRSL